MHKLLEARILSCYLSKNEEEPIRFMSELSGIIMSLVLLERGFSFFSYSSGS